MFKSVSQSDLPKLDSHLESRAYLAGFTPSHNDYLMYSYVCSMDVAKEFPHVLRWAAHMKSYSEEERMAFPKKGKICDFAPAASTIKAEDKPAAKAETADLFGSDDESDDAETLAEKEALQARLEKKKNPKGKVEKSMVVLEIKPIDDESNMDYVKENLPKMVVMDGLSWGESEFQPLCYGLQALVIACTVVDDDCSVDELCDLIVNTFEEYVQSCDVRSFNKLG